MNKKEWLLKNMEGAPLFGKAEPKESEKEPAKPEAKKDKKAKK
jgi:hypothetical protein